MEAVMKRKLISYLREISVEIFSIFSDSMITVEMYGCFSEVVIASCSKIHVYEIVILKNMIRM